MKKISLLLVLFIVFVACKPAQKTENEKFTVVTTTTMITDLVKVLGGDAIEVKGIMGAGVDPHLYKASEGDVTKLSQADLIIYNGLHLEGKLVDVFEKMNQMGKQTLALGDFLSHEQIINSEAFASSHDPHIWFSINNWKSITELLVNELIKKDPENTAIYTKNGTAYVKQLRALKDEMEAKIAELPIEKRILVTAHDAFSYFGKEFDFEVVGLQGLSTATEAGVKDVQRISDYIIKNKVKAIFVESSVPKRTVEALQASVNSKGQKVIIGGELFSDALGNPTEETGKYIGMFKYNVNTIVDALK
ncbi:manganese/zinc/iron transport system substrate-binding protein [Wenyingzhuangia heitensis]|uniref:Manganese/zinc/iron transport system substrate-binding protein n=1 Tax=Wenyingzhuangia heitensis TaxID=1487859 RepID=A0ABX0U4E5_9FLAO|nr:zinc ABC transporter substrate-binding protein [Wenyingzhuangia heitensis]NIJ43729.1 manganese/zinc/iron transport system substrate-binding protein [Wenyingzhuangia heitensis]